MGLKPGDSVTCEMTGSQVMVKQKLGHGGQGIVFLAEGAKGNYALKWYNPEQSTPAQQQAIRTLVQKGAPDGEAGKRFIWPLDIATSSSHSQFGYLMPLIDMQRYASLGDIWSHRRKAPGFKAMCEISYQFANSYRALHLKGMCYCDISSGNLLFDPETGNVLICDNDNVGVDGHSEAQVWGTDEYMAPEVMLRTASPSTKTDLHSLAVLLFQFWVWHHPFHGMMEDAIRSWDVPARRFIYGESPVFIFDPNDKRNQLPGEPQYNMVHKRWSCCPQPLKEMFTRSFTLGLKEPAQRVTEGEWQNLFRQFKDHIISCPNDHAENIWVPEQEPLNCWHCGTTLPVPPKLVLTGVRGKTCFLLSPQTHLLTRHVSSTASADESKASIPVAQVVQNPNNPSVWGLRNLSSEAWTGTFPDGTTQPIPPQKAAPLSQGLKINFGQVTGEITA
jgi:eukaryotic-like serine/threonine-protein kinase